jgi:FG-GAP-like repeat/PASTA domain/FG-GAP repeat
VNRGLRSRPGPSAVGARAAAVFLGCIGVALSLGVVARSAAPRPGPSFAAAKHYPTGGGPISVASADLNGDAKPDLATANDAGSVSILLNQGRGRFAIKRDYATGQHPYLIRAGDLNVDGKPDLVTANESRATSLWVFLNRGDGSFEAGRNYPIPNGTSSNVAIADLGGDGKPDLVVESNDASTVSVLVNHGDGTFEASRNYATGKGPDAVATGDLNGDGKPDLVTRNKASVSVLFNRGDGSFEGKRDYAAGGGGSFSPAIVDVSGDDKPDLVFDSNAPVAGVSVMLNSGDGSFRAVDDYLGCWPCFDLSQGSRVDAIAVADLNGDGMPDIATKLSYQQLHQESLGAVSVFLNKGNGTFKGQRSYRTGLADSYDLSPERLAINDLNGDRAPELTTVDFGISVLVNRGDGTFRPRLDYTGGGSVVTDDLNGDGKPDVVTTGKNSVLVLINTPGLCNVQYVVGTTLAAAKARLARAHCRVGKLRRRYARSTRKGRVISQKPKFGAVRHGGAKVKLVVSKGRRK